MPAAADTKAQALLERRRLEVQADLPEDLGELEVVGVDVDAAAVDAGDVEQLGEQALERVDRFVDAVDELRHLGLVRARPKRLGEQAHRVQRLAQVVACRGEELGLRPVRDLGLLARRFGHRLLGPQLHGEAFGPKLQADDAFERLGVVATEEERHRHRDRHHERDLPAECRVVQRDSRDRRREHEEHEEHEEAVLRREDRHAGNAEGIDDDHEGELVQAAAERPEKPRRRAPERAAGEHADVPGAQARGQTGDGLWLGAHEAQGEPEAREPDEREGSAPDRAHRQRRDAGVDELDDDRADRMAGERGAVERKGAADVVAQQQVVVDRRVAAQPRRPGGAARAGDDGAQCAGRESHGAMAPWPDIWLTARTAWVRELTLRARSTAAT